MQNSDANKQEQQVLELLRDYPAPAADADFYERALVRATHEGSKRQRNRWMLTGFGAAVAATVAAWMIGGLLLNEPQLPEAGAAIPGVTIALAEPRTVNLVFASATTLDSATLTVTLPDGIELDGFPGQREITWETSLSEGRNLLPLTLVAVTPTGGELLAHLEHEERDRTFRLRVEVG
ncbi:MAG: hypothetical protein QNJ23_06755 [Woeseiaceae bacterium]|nr:hypothetical protein [Woeseiaceae bacterium]